MLSKASGNVQNVGETNGSLVTETDLDGSKRATPGPKTSILTAVAAGDAQY